MFLLLWKNLSAGNFKKKLVAVIEDGKTKIVLVKIFQELIFIVPYRKQKSPSNKIEKLIIWANYRLLDSYFE